MQPFEPLRGRWWIPGNEEANVPGELTFSREAGARLELDGDLHGIETERAIPGEPRPIVHGRAADDTLVTLVSASEANGSIRVFGGGPAIQRTVYRPEIVYLGDHYDEEPLFTYARVEFTHFDKWLGNLELLPVHHYGPSGLLDKYSVDCEWPDPVEVESVHGRLRVQGAYDVSQVGNERVTLRTGGYVEWHLYERATFRRLLRAVTEFQMLLALLTDYPVVAEHITLKPDAEHSKESRVFFQAAHETPEREPFDERYMFFSMPRLPIPLQELVPQWERVHEDFETAANVLTSLRYTAPGVTDLQFMSMVQACEAFHAAGYPNMVLPKDEFDARKAALKASLDHDLWTWIGGRINNEPSLKMRLLALMNEVEPVLAPVALVSIDRCASQIRDIRNDMTHPRNERRIDAGGVHFLYYARLLSFLLKVQFIRVLGLLDDDTMARLQSSRQSSAVASLGAHVRVLDKLE